MSATSHTQYDALGRVTQSSQTTAGQTYGFAYSYDAAGGLKTMTLPSGRVLTYGYDGAGRIRSVTGQKSAVTTTLASAMTYASHGALTSVTLGNGLGESRAYGERLQAASVSLGGLLGLTFSYCPGGGQLCSTNNGNLLSQTILPLGVTQGYTQYDGVNRLKIATEGSWTQTYAYDRMGNRAVVAGSWVPLSNETPQVPNEQSPLPFTNNRWSGASHDGAGNLTAVNGKTFAFDGESRMKTDTTGSGTMTYQYDGDGRRVETLSGGTTTVYVYDAFGKLAAEHTTGAPSGPGGTNYITTDHLGSTRLLTNTTGGVVVRYDYLPFGEEIPAGVSGRTTAMGYGDGVAADGFKQRFTGKERDAETGLDYFGARYFSGAQGRFTSPDTPLVDQYPSDPQSWNLYGYVRNNPLRSIDPTGNDCVYTNTYDEKAGTVMVETGSCSQKGGTYVAGTIDSITLNSNGNYLSVGYTAYEGGTASSTPVDLPNRNPGLEAVQRGVLMAEPGVNIAAAGTAAVMGGAFAGMAYGALAGGTALTTLSIPAATLPPLVSNPTLQSIVNKLFQVTDKLPGGTAGAVRYELATGDLMSPSGHSGKAQEVIVALTNLLKSGKLSYNDQIVSRQIIQELSDALKTQPRR